MPTLYIMCGIPASGKTTWCREFMKAQDEIGNDVRYISRDEIRFAFLQKDDDYFAHEMQVFKKFAGAIAQTLADGFDIIADATHINTFSRRKLINAVDESYADYNIVFVVVDTDFTECLKRNEEREGREHLPPDAIQKMRRNFIAPTLAEDERVTDIINVGFSYDESYYDWPYRNEGENGAD